MVKLRLHQAGGFKEILCPRVVEVRGARIGLGLSELRLGLGELCLRLVYALLIVSGADPCQFSIPGDMVTRLNIAQPSVGASHLSDPLDQPRRLKRQVHLCDGHNAG